MVGGQCKVGPFYALWEKGKACDLDITIVSPLGGWVDIVN